MGIGPLIAWRQHELRALVRTLAWPIVTAIVAGVALVAVGAGSSTPGLIAYTFSAFVLATIVVELVRGTRATGSLFMLVSRNRRRYGGYIVHAAIVLLAIGIAGSSAYGTTREHASAAGAVDEASPATRSPTSGSSDHERPEPHGRLCGPDVGGHWHGTLRTGDITYTGFQETDRDVGIKTDWLRGEDLYVIADFVPHSTAVDFKVLVKPLVNLIWVAGFVFLLGSLVALWPDAREQRRLVTRLAPARA